jgi:hypothetical protein
MSEGWEKNIEEANKLVMHEEVLTTYTLCVTLRHFVSSIILNCSLAEAVPDPEHQTFFFVMSVNLLELIIVWVQHWTNRDREAE